jgi:hypothetical protein
MKIVVLLRIVLILVCGLFFSATASAFRLPDTGQMSCSDTNGNVIGCTGTGQDGEYNINPMSYTDNGNGTVTDNNTGLMWQQQDAGNEYNWYQATGTYDTSYDPSSQNACGAFNLGGYSDWRLPSKKELMTIVDYSVPYPGPTINLIFENIQEDAYWSSTGYPNDPSGAWEVSFGTGAIGYYVSKINSFHVLCVRGELYPAQSFEDNANGTVTDI